MIGRFRSAFFGRKSTWRWSNPLAKSSSSKRGAHGRRRLPADGGAPWPARRAAATLEGSDDVRFRGGGRGWGARVDGRCMAPLLLPAIRTKEQGWAVSCQYILCKKVQKEKLYVKSKMERWGRRGKAPHQEKQEPWSVVAALPFRGARARGGRMGSRASAPFPHAQFAQPLPPTRDFRTLETRWRPQHAACGNRLFISGPGVHACETTAAGRGGATAVGCSSHALSPDHVASSPDFPPSLTDASPHPRNPPCSLLSNRVTSS